MSKLIYYASCIDCGRVFHGTEYKSHTSCISEAEKYQGKLYKPKEKKEAKKEAKKEEKKPEKKVEKAAEKRKAEEPKKAESSKKQKTDIKKKEPCCDKMKERIKDEVIEQIGGVCFTFIKIMVQSHVE